MYLWLRVVCLDRWKQSTVLLAALSKDRWWKRSRWFSTVGLKLCCRAYSRRTSALNAVSSCTSCSRQNLMSTSFDVLCQVKFVEDTHQAHGVGTKLFFRRLSNCVATVGGGQGWLDDSSRSVGRDSAPAPDTRSNISCDDLAFPSLFSSDVHASVWGQSWVDDS